MAHPRRIRVPPILLGWLLGLTLGSSASGSILPEKSPRHAVQMAELADISYLPADKLDGVLEKRGLAKQLVIDRSLPGLDADTKLARSTFLYTAIALSGNTEIPPGSLVIVIRGSHTANDWYTNAHAQLDPWVAGKNKGKGRLHHGFLAVAKVAVDSVMDSVRAAKRIYLVGHSLGGAAAVILAAHLVELGIAPDCMQIFTFGAPMPGDREFASHYAGKLDFFEYRNSKDPFFVLPSSKQYRHLCDERPERFVPLTRAEWSINDHIANFSDHHMWSYVYRMHGHDVDVLCARFSMRPEDIKLPFALPQRLSPVLERVRESAKSVGARMRELVR